MVYLEIYNTVTSIGQMWSSIMFPSVSQFPQTERFYHSFWQLNQRDIVSVISLACEPSEFG